MNDIIKQPLLKSGLCFIGDKYRIEIIQRIKPNHITKIPWYELSINGKVEKKSIIDIYLTLHNDNCREREATDEHHDDS